MPPKTIRRRSILMSAALALPLLQVTAAEAEEAKQADFLFVQTAKSMTFDKASGKLTLVDVSPITVMFADRPERIAGNMKTARFVPFWSEGKDSFLKDPPNADISIVEGDSMRQVVATLEQPEIKDGNLSYTVTILRGARCRRPVRMSPSSSMSSECRLHRCHMRVLRGARIAGPFSTSRPAPV